MVFNKDENNGRRLKTIPRQSIYLSHHELLSVYQRLHLELLQDIPLCRCHGAIALRIDGQPCRDLVTLEVRWNRVDDVGSFGGAQEDTEEDVGDSSIVDDETGWPVYGQCVNVDVNRFCGEGRWEEVKIMGKLVIEIHI